MDCSTDKTDNQIAILWDTTYGMDWPLEINDAMLPGKPKIRDTCPGYAVIGTILLRFE